jgi:hypothetical protein
LQRTPDYQVEARRYSGSGNERLFMAVSTSLPAIGETRCSISLLCASNDPDNDGALIL